MNSETTKHLSLYGMIVDDEKCLSGIVQALIARGVFFQAEPYGNEIGWWRVAVKREDAHHLP